MVFTSSCLHLLSCLLSYFKFYLFALCYVIMAFQSSLPFLTMDDGEACFKGLHQPFEQQQMQQEEILLTSPSTSAFVPTSCFSLNQPVLVDLTLSISALMEKNQEEMDQYLQLQNERLVVSLYEQRKRHMESLVNNLQAKAAVLLKMKEDELAMASMRYQELDEKLKKAEESKEVWQKIARKNEAKIVFLRNTLEQMQQPQFSSTKVATVVGGDSNSLSPRERRKGNEPTGDPDKVFFPCRRCGSRNACQLLLPCRHLCVCKQCADSLAACPLCNSEKIGSVKVLF